MRVITVAFILAHAASAAAQVFVAEPKVAVEPTGAQKTALANWARDVWPAITPSEVVRAKCVRKVEDVDEVPTTGARCMAITEPTLSDTDYDTEEAAGRIVSLPAPGGIPSDGSEAVVMLRYGPEFVHGANVVTLANIANDIFSIPAGQLYRLDIRRLPADETHPSPYFIVVATRRRQVTTTQRLQCIRDGTCTRRLP